MRVAARFLAFALGLIASTSSLADTKVVARAGDGYLEVIDGYKVLHVKGTPYQMGYQQGSLLKDDIRELVRFLFDVKAAEFGEALRLQVGGVTLLKPDAKAIIRGIAASQERFIPDWYFEELRGVADASGVDYEEIRLANFIPELFHCSGFAISGSATRDGTLYHGRILDYGCDWQLQNHAVLVIAQPEGKIPFANITYAGFIGCVTGINAERVSLGEMGGGGFGRWAGVPMAVLMRMALQDAHSLSEAVAIFRDHPRTCEYYYVIADGEEQRAVGMEASWSRFGTIAMGESHPRLPHPVRDCVLLSAGDRYAELVRRVESGFGTFDAESALRLMDRPVSMRSNLHSVLFEVSSTRIWIANASIRGEPASSQPYHEFSLTKLLSRHP